MSGTLAQRDLVGIGGTSNDVQVPCHTDGASSIVLCNRDLVLGAYARGSGWVAVGIDLPRLRVPRPCGRNQVWLLLVRLVVFLCYLHNRIGHVDGQCPCGRAIKRGVVPGQDGHIVYPGDDDLLVAGIVVRDKATSYCLVHPGIVLPLDGILLFEWNDKRKNRVIHGQGEES